MKTITDIVAPIDLDEHSGKVVEYAAFIAEKLSAKLTLVHVVELFQAIGDMVLGTETIEDYNKKRVEHSKELLRKLMADFPNCNGRVITGEIVDEIVSFAEEQGAGLIVIGTHGSKGLEKLLLGSVAERVVKRAHCPTLVMNPYKHKGL